MSAERVFADGRSRVNSFASTALADEAQALNLAKHFFQYYNKKNDEELDSFEVALILIDIYKGIGKEISPTETEIAQYMQLLDYDMDGRVTLSDIEHMMRRYLCGQID